MKASPLKQPLREGKRRSQSFWEGLRHTETWGTLDTTKSKCHLQTSPPAPATRPSPPPRCCLVNIFRHTVPFFCLRSMVDQQILRDMWQQDPRNRPSAKRVVQRLEILLEQINGEALEVSGDG